MGITGNVHSIETFGTVDGPGIRYVLFMQGCPLRCKFCHNPDTWEVGRGQGMDSDEVISEVKQYLQFYRSSGGGVTASGGEPAMQPEFVSAVFTGVKRLGLNTALDTSGFVDLSSLEGLLGNTDLVIMDVKEIDEEAHVELTGVKSDKIRAAADEIDRRGIPLWIRHVIIPGITGSEEKLRKLGLYLRSLRSVQRIELLGYHKLGSHKWNLKGCGDPLAEIPAATQEEIEKARNFLQGMGLINIF